MASRDPASPARCPKCDEHMDTANVSGGETVLRCESCRGIFCPNTALQSMQRTWFDWPKLYVERSVDDGNRATGQYFNERGNIRCPLDRSRMDNVVVEDQPHIWIERCPECGGAFFDAGELTDLRYKTLADTVRRWIRPRRSDA